jgi:Metallo-peptidase family M12
MRSGTKTLLILLLVLLVNAGCRSTWKGLLGYTGTPTPGGGSRTPALLRPTDRTGTAPGTRDPAIVRRRNVIIDLQRLQPGARLGVPLFDDVSLEIVIDRQEKIETRDEKSGSVWYGQVAGQPGSTVVLARSGDALAGTIHGQGDRFYQIVYAGRGIHTVQEIDPTRILQEADPDRPELSPSDKDADTCATDPPSDIDALVLYTDDARAAAGSTEAIEALVYLAVAETNLSYLNSQIDQRLRLAYLGEVSYNETGNVTTDRDAFRNKADGVLDNVHTLRDTYAADVNVLVVETSNACGQAFIMDPVSNAFESYAFAVVKRQSCATGNFSFGHELGHIMSARHDWDDDDTDNSPYTFNHGYIDTAPTSPATPWRTVMAYNGTPSSTRLPFWSNPNVNFPPGDPMGVPIGSFHAADNHQTLNNTALTVANFRCSSPAVSNVWMKDTWNDTGAEPDPKTAGEGMWQSPYIWVRNSQDTNLTKQHQHQNPEFGSPNWVYTKIHNGGGTMASGTLELYWANASVSLTWPGGWTLLKSIPVNSFAAHSTRVVEAEWTSLPGIGHYCMIARWVSTSDPMTHAETPDINLNVRNNNNLIWRNLNIVDLTADMSMTTDLIVRTLDPRDPVTSLTIGPPRKEIADSFIRHGRLSVRFDGRLMAVWQAGGAQGKGFKIDGDSFVLTDPAGAVFENIALPLDLEGHAELTFTRLPTTPRQRFWIDVTQFGGRQRDGANAGPKVVGGVSYEIHTDYVAH